MQFILLILTPSKLLFTRMHSSRMRTVRCSCHLSCHAYHPPLSHMPIAMHAPLCHARPHHACPLPHMPPLPCMSPAMHALPTTHVLPPYMPPMNAPSFTCPLSCTVPCHTCPLPRMPPVNRQTSVKTLPFRNYF